jgi:excisionase family DNA binding protein
MFDSRTRLTEGTWSTDEAASYLGCTPLTLRQWVSKRRVPFLKIGRLVRFRQKDLEEFLESRLIPAER